MLTMPSWRGLDDAVDLVALLLAMRLAMGGCCAVTSQARTRPAVRRRGTSRWELDGEQGEGELEADLLLLLGGNTSTDAVQVWLRRGGRWRRRGWPVRPGQRGLDGLEARISPTGDDVGILALGRT
jgi:hypothetical protein